MTEKNPQQHSDHSGKPASGAQQPGKPAAGGQQHSDQSGKPGSGAQQAPHQKEQQKNGPAQTAEKHPERPENAAKRS